jgi:hypothetical protein
VTVESRTETVTCDECGRDAERFTHSDGSTSVYCRRCVREHVRATEEHAALIRAQLPVLRCALGERLIRTVVRLEGDNALRVLLTASDFELLAYRNIGQSAVALLRTAIAAPPTQHCATCRCATHGQIVVWVDGEAWRLPAWRA